MKYALFTGLISVTLTCAFGQENRPENFIRFVFTVDHKAIACEPLNIGLRLHDHESIPETKQEGFWAPVEFVKDAGKWSEADRVTINVSCRNYALDFEIHPDFVRGGDWEAGILYPPVWIEQASAEVIEHGTWLSYLQMECSGCDP